MMTFPDKVQYLREHLRLIAETLGTNIVIVTDDLVMRWPPCDDGCRSPLNCSAMIFKSAADILVDKSKELQKGDE